MLISFLPPEIALFLSFPCVCRPVASCGVSDPLGANRGHGNPHSVATKQDWQAQQRPPGRAPRLGRREVVTCQELALLLKVAVKRENSFIVVPDPL